MGPDRVVVASPALDDDLGLAMKHTVKTALGPVVRYLIREPAADYLNSQCQHHSLCFVDDRVQEQACSRDVLWIWGRVHDYEFNSQSWMRGLSI